jgi:hypothetical protein
MADRTLTSLSRDSGKVIDLPEHTIGFGNNALPRLRQSDLSLVSLEQLDPELLFELAYLLTEWRLADVEAYCGAAEVQLFGDGDKIAQMSKLHQPTKVV